MSELITTLPNINLLNMSDVEIWALVDTFLAREACNRLQLDIGQIFESAKLDPLQMVLRINDMHAYLKAEISSQMSKVRQKTPNPAPSDLLVIMHQALQHTFEVYEGTV